MNGPMSESLHSLGLFAKAVVESEPWMRDPRCIPVPWRQIEPKSRLKLAVCWHDGVVRPTPPVARALEEVAARLRSAGHEIVDWDPKFHEAAADILVSSTIEIADFIFFKVATQSFTDYSLGSYVYSRWC